MAYTKSNEGQIQSAICDYLALKKHFFWRINNTPISMMKNGNRVFRAMPKHSMKGVADIIVITEGGYAVFLEVKDKSKQSDDQKLFQEKCKEKGCEYHIVRSIDNLKEIGL